MKFTWKKSYFRPIIPFCVILYMAYAEWVFSYFFCYKHIYLQFNDKKSMISFLVVANFFWLISLISWIFLCLKGPGKLPLKMPPYELSNCIYNGENLKHERKISNNSNVFDSLSTQFSMVNNNTISPPNIFECDFNGLPFWCFHCSSLKILRSHHSSVNNRCIPLFDHFCSFVGFTIGKGNFLYFLSFVFSIEILMCFTWIGIVTYGGIWNKLQASLIVFEIITGILLLTVGNLIINLFLDLFKGETTIERLNRQRWEKSIKNNNHLSTHCKYVNVQHPTNMDLRLVIKLSPSTQLYNNGFKKNFQLWLYNFKRFKTIHDILIFQDSLFSDHFKQEITTKINNKDFIIFGSQNKLESVEI